VAALLMIVLAVYSIKNRGVPGAIPFTFACIFGLLWMFGSVGEYAAVDIATKIFWRKFSVIWQLPSATAIVCFLLEYAWPKRWLNRRNLVLLSVIPVLTTFLIITNHLHQLFWVGFNYVGTLTADLGPFAQYSLVYVYLLSLVNLIIFVWLFIRSPQNRWPVVIMLIGQIIIRLFYFADVYRRAPFHYANAAVGLAIGSMIYAVVLFRFRIFGPIPLARQAVMEQISIGMLVLDHQKQINSINPAAERMLGISKKRLKNQPIWDILDACNPDVLNDGQDHQIDFIFETDGRVRDYQLDILPLKDWRDLQVGQLLLLIDVTEQHKNQAMILEQQRVLATLQERDLLARELHDDLAQVLAFIDTQGQTVRRLLKQGDLASADACLARLVEVARSGEIDLRDSIRGMRLTLSAHGLFATLEQHLDHIQENFGIRIHLEQSESFDENLLQPLVEAQLLRILQEALTNIRKHAQADKVTIKFEAIDHQVCVTIEDNGQGFDPAESQMDRKQHFGLQMMRERAESIGGTLNLISGPGMGTEISVCVPYDGITR
jgi:PAS domain S-box-containing protein